MIEPIDYFKKRKFDELFPSLSHWSVTDSLIKITDFIRSKDCGMLGVVTTKDSKFLHRKHRDKTWIKYNVEKWDEYFSVWGDGELVCIYYKGSLDEQENK